MATGKSSVSPSEERAGKLRLLPAEVAAAFLRLEKRERAGARRLLNAERHALRALTEATERHTDHLVAQAATDGAWSEAARDRAARAAVRLSLPSLHSSLTHAVSHSRQVARAVAADDLAPHVHEQALREAADDGHDAPRAYAAAAGLAAAWGTLALAAVNERGNAKPLPMRIGAITGRFESRLRRTAATEVAHAFTGAGSRVMVAHAGAIEQIEARRGDGRGLARRPPIPSGGDPAELPPMPGGPYRGGPYRDAPPPREPGLRPIKVWSALLDGRVCPACAAMYGTAVDVRDEFPGGDPPRHPFCRCLPVFLMTAVPLNEIERAYELLAA